MITTYHVAFDRDPRLPKTPDTSHKIAPLSLKTRRGTYSVKKSDETIHIILYPLTFHEFSDLYPELTIHEKMAHYSKMQPPVQSVDCDSYTIAKDTQSLWEATLDYKQQHPEIDDHGTPHHNETISEHILLVAFELQKIFTELTTTEFNTLFLATLYHDLGKYWTKTFDENVGYYRYPNHENVSAMIFVTHMALNPTLYQEIRASREELIKIVTQIILNHMFYKTSDCNEKTIKRRKLTPTECRLLDVFTQADNNGRKN